MADDVKPTRRDEQLREVEALSHAVQSGVAYELGEHSEVGSQLGSSSPKHLRTGVNLRAVEHGALVALLLERGIIDEEGYFDALIAGLQREKRSLEKSLSKKLNAGISLA